MTKKKNTLYDRVRQILESARSTVARSVNSTQVVANWLIGREIVEEEQKGKARAEYGDELIRDLAKRLAADFGAGYSKDNLFWFRRLYQGYPELLARQKIDAVRQISASVPRKSTDTGAAEDITPTPRAMHGMSAMKILHASRGESWTPGQLHPNLSWTHYRTLLRVDKPEARAFYEIEAIKNNWAARELERQICSLLAP